MDESSIPQNQNLLFQGKITNANTTRFNNSFAIQAISNIIKSSFGPKGLDKMLVDETGKITITNDGATILKLIDVQEPTAKLLVQMSRSQDISAGDGTTSVAIFAASLIKEGIELINDGIHPATVTSGLIKASKEAIQFISDEMSYSQEEYIEHISEKEEKGLLNSILASKKKRTSKKGGGEEIMLMDAIITSLQSKIISVKIEDFASIVAEAAVFHKDEGVNSIQVLMRAGHSMSDSKLLRGYAIPTIPLNEKEFSQGVVKGRFLLVAADFNPKRLDLGTKINLDDPSTVDLIREKEQSFPIQAIRNLKEQGVVGIISSGGFSKESIRELEKVGMVALRRVEYVHLDRLAKLFKCRIFGSIDSFARKEAEDATEDKGLDFGEAELEQVCLEEGSIVLVRDLKDSRRSVLLRGPNEYVLKEAERSLHDALCVAIKLVSGENNSICKVVPGGGSTEMAASVFIEELAHTFKSKTRVVFEMFAKALQSLPEALAKNGGFQVSSTLRELKKRYVANMRRKSLGDSSEITCLAGISKSRENPIQENMLKIGIVEPLTSKLKQIELATEAALTILRVDASINIYSDEKKN